MYVRLCIYPTPSSPASYDTGPEFKQNKVNSSTWMALELNNQQK